MKIGQWLMEEKVPLKELAKRLEVSVRTLHNWRDEAKRAAPSKIGRPRLSQAQHKKALWLVGRELRRQGYPGWRAISKSLKSQVPDRLIQLYVQRFKLHRRKCLRQLRTKHRVEVKVRSRNVVWAQDGTHLGRCKRKSIEAQVIKDRGSKKIIAVSTGACATGDDVIELLDTVKRDRGLPLVWSTDNGSMYVDEKVEAYLEKEKIIHLKSLPRTPEHNGAAEVGMREIKNGSTLGKGRILEGAEEAHGELLSTIELLNKNRLRASFNYESASSVDQKLPLVYTDEVRSRFYAECVDGMQSAAELGLSMRRERQEVRNVILSKLQKYGFIELKRGEGY